MTPSPRPPGLPTPIRLALLVAVALGALVSFGAARDVAIALTIKGPAPVEGTESALPGLGLTPQAQRAVALAMFAGMRGAVESMVGSRVVISMLLSSAASLIFVLSLRLRWGAQGPRLPLLTLLRRFAVAAAVLRTMDGAQQLVISQSMIASFANALAKENVPEAEALQRLGPPLMSAMSVGWTVLVVGLFVALSRFFAAESVAEAFARADGPG